MQAEVRSLDREKLDVGTASHSKRHSCTERCLSGTALLIPKSFKSS